MAQSPDTHRLYVYKVGPQPRNGAEARARETTLKLLRYAKKQKPTLARMGVNLKIIPLSRANLGDARVRGGLQKVFGEKVKVSFPALRTPHDQYFGFTQIHALYESNLQNFRRARMGGGGTIADEEDDPLAAYYSEEMTMAGATRDRGHDEEPVGEEKDMMSAYRNMMKKRDARRLKKDPVVPGGKPLPPKKKAAKPVAPRRPGNVKDGAADDPMAALDALEADGEDPTGSAADDMMMRAFLENLEES